MPTKHQKFEEEVRKFLSKKWNKKFEKRKVLIVNFEKKFDLVSGNFKKKFKLVSKGIDCIGDVKYYKNTKSPSGKMSTICEYVWLLEKTNAMKKFLVFGRDIQIPNRWLYRFGPLTKIEFYYYRNKQLTRLN